MAQKTVLIVEDEVTQSALLEGIVVRAGHKPHVAFSGADAVKFLNSSKGQETDIMLLDLVMPGMDGIAVLQKIRPNWPELPVIMLTAQSSITTVVDAMRAGANDFIVKPASAERIRSAISAGLQTASFVGEIEPMRKGMTATGFANLIGDSPAMRRAVELAERASGASIPVLVDGESGVGKEVFARAIHAASDRSDWPFVAVNCGAIPENLVESILFGHEKGSFTGATEKRIGKFEEAHGGTLFLDEVGELPADIQVKLLRALQEKEIDPVGGRCSLPVDIRIISATNRDLATLVAEGGFREDLFYRLNVYPITLPPLRKRREDIPALVSHFLKLIPEMEDLPAKTIAPSALEGLAAHHWPGNIRQLQNALFRAVILSDQSQLAIHDFPHLESAPSRVSTYRNETDSLSSGPANEETTHFSAGMAVDDTVISLLATDGNFRSLADIEAEIIRRSIAHYEGKMAEVARRLGIGRSTLYRKLDDYGLKR